MSFVKYLNLIALLRYTCCYPAEIHCFHSCCLLLQSSPQIIPLSFGRKYFSEDQFWNKYNRIIFVKIQSYPGFKGLGVDFAFHVSQEGVEQK